MQSLGGHLADRPPGMCLFDPQQEESALQIALRKEHVEIVEMINNPPEVTRLSSKREEKRAKAESGSSSKEGSGKHIDKKKVRAVDR